MDKPVVSIVGRPNVGKSTLFNDLVGERIAIVEDTPGVTRDRIIEDVEWRNRVFSLIDTGGIEPLSKDDLLSQMRLQAETAVELSDLIILLVDGREGLTANDFTIAQMLRKANKPNLLVVNKIDNLKLEDEKYEFYNLGMGDPITISASQKLGLGDLLDEILESLNIEANIDEEEEDEGIRVAIVGKPNAGKSTLINRLLGEDRLVVSDEPGTTRDAVDTQLIKDGKEYTFIDTAGIRRKKKISEKIEQYSILRAVTAVERADVVVLMIDAEQGVTEQDQKIASIIQNRYKPCIIIVNKWDKIEKNSNTMREMKEEIRNRLIFLNYAPILFISALTGQRVNKIYDEIDYVYNQARKRVPTGQFNNALIDFVTYNEPKVKGSRRLKFYYGSQVGIDPPTFVLYANNPNLMHFSYKRYLENSIRKYFDFEGTPIRIHVRERDRKKT